MQKLTSELELGRLPDSEQNRILVEIATTIANCFPEAADAFERPFVTPAIVEPLRRETTLALGALHGVPELPHHYLPRQDELEKLKLGCEVGRLELTIREARACCAETLSR